MNSIRPAGAIADTLNPHTLLELGRAALLKAHPDAAPNALTHGPTPQMLITVEDDALAVVNGEGVGTVANGDTVEVYFAYGMTYLPLQIPTEKLRTAITSEMVDLADGIRTFGIRLDVNHGFWLRRYTGRA